MFHDWRVPFSWASVAERTIFGVCAFVGVTCKLFHWHKTKSQCNFFFYKFHCRRLLKLNRQRKSTPFLCLKNCPTTRNNWVHCICMQQAAVSDLACQCYCSQARRWRPHLHKCDVHLLHCDESLNIHNTLSTIQANKCYARAWPG